MGCNVGTSPGWITCQPINDETCIEKNQLKYKHISPKCREGITPLEAATGFHSEVAVQSDTPYKEVA